MVREAILVLLSERKITVDEAVEMLDTRLCPSVVKSITSFVVGLAIGTSPLWMKLLH